MENRNELAKEFETLGFFISDHPVNQYKSLFNQYNIVDFENFEKNDDILSSNIACTVLKIQEKKTQKGSSYAIVKFSDLSGAFELFIFSDVFETNREILVEGNSLMITLIKSSLNEDSTQKRINIKKITSLREIINKPIDQLKIRIKDIKDLDKLKSLDKVEGKTSISLEIEKDEKVYYFLLKDKRKVDQNIVNSMNTDDNIKIN